MVKQDLCSMVRDFFDKGSLEPGINETVLVLIPKKDNPNSLKDYRPISLCNVTYKIIYKILVLLLRPILSRITSPTQGAFVMGRKAIDQIVVAREMVHNMSKLKGSRPTVAVKLDVEKAYDTLQWDFHSAWV